MRKRLVTLTFDNGPTVETTPFVLDQLREHDLAAYFCLVGTQLQKGREQVDIASEALARGHRLVNHSLTHTVALGDDPSPAHAGREVTEMHAIMCEMLGNWGEPWFRPFGRGGEVGPHIFSRAALAALTSLDYSVLLWNCVPRDWEDRQGWVDTAIKDIACRDHTVLVLHDLDTGAMVELPRLLDWLADNQCEVTLELPEDSVPIRRSQTCWREDAFAQLIST